MFRRFSKFDHCNLLVRVSSRANCVDLPEPFLREAHRASFLTVANVRPEVVSHSFHNINNQADNHQRTDQSVSKHCCLLVFGLRLSMECYGRRRFHVQHPEKGMATTFHQFQQHHDDIQNECLCCCERLRMEPSYIVKSRAITMGFRRVRWPAALIFAGAFAVPVCMGASDLSAAVIQDSQQPGNPNPSDPSSPNNPPTKPNGPNPPGANNPDKPYAPKPKNPNDRKAPPKSPPSGPNNPNPPSGPNNPNPPSGPAPSAPSGPGGTGGAGGSGAGTR